MTQSHLVTNASDSLLSVDVAIIGGGPAGLMAAEAAASTGCRVAVFDAMPSVGRKFLLAGIGGMNITHAEPFTDFLARFSDFPILTSALTVFPPDALREWIHGLGIDTFVGTSGRVFPTDMKAAPLLRAWLQRLRGLGVSFYPRHRWMGWQGEHLVLSHPDGERVVHASATVLALGGASWPRLGSTGEWTTLLTEHQVTITPLVPSNCGFECDWSEKLRADFAGAPLHNIGLAVKGRASIRTEAILSEYGIEGTGVYALSRPLREQLQQGPAELLIDLLPDWTLSKIEQQLAKPRGKNSQSNFLRKQLNLPPVKLALLRECTSQEVWSSPTALAHAIKQLPLRLLRMRPIDEAISSAGGIAHSAMTETLMLKALPGVFCAGEMLDWDAPTGGYLLSGCFATGRTAGHHAGLWATSSQSEA